MRRRLGAGGIDALCEWLFTLEAKRAVHAHELEQLNAGARAYEPLALIPVSSWFDREIGLRMQKARHMIVTGGPFPLPREGH